MLADQDLNTSYTIYVRLLDEGVDVWRPVLAFALGSGPINGEGLSALSIC